MPPAVASEDKSMCAGSECAGGLVTAAASVVWLAKSGRESLGAEKVSQDALQGEEAQSRPHGRKQPPWGACRGRP